MSLVHLTLVLWRLSLGLVLLNWWILCTPRGLGQTGLVDESFLPEIDSGLTILRLILQPDGKFIVAVGLPPDSFMDRIEFLRLNDDGSRDSSFVSLVGRSGAGDSQFNAVNVDYEIFGGTAIPGQDYELLQAATISFAGWGVHSGAEWVKINSSSPYQRCFF